MVQLEITHNQFNTIPSIVHTSPLTPAAVMATVPGLPGPVPAVEAVSGAASGTLRALAARRPSAQLEPHLSDVPSVADVIHGAGARPQRRHDG